MKRPMLISGITMTIVCTFLMLFSKSAAIVMIVLSASAFILYSIKPLKLRKHIKIPMVCLFALLITVSFLSYTHYKIEPLLQYDSQTTYISGKIITTPITANGYNYFTLQTENVSNKNVIIKLDVTIPENACEDIKLYDHISINKAELYVPKNEHNKPDFKQSSDGIFLTAYSDSVTLLGHAERTPFYYCLKFKEIINNKINDFMHPDTAGLLKGMLFGDSAEIEYDTLKAFRNSGIAHLLAVSGLHTSLWCGLLMLLLNCLKVPEKARNIICIFFLAAFCTISAFTPSVIRASLMMLVLLIAPFFKRKPDTLNSLGLAITVLLLCNPYIIMSISFQLSVTATFGVLAASSYENTIKKKTSIIKPKALKGLCDYILCSLLISTAAGIFTLPISAYYFNVFSIISPIANILCVKLAFYGMISGTVATGLAFIENVHVKNVVIFIFDITEYILNTVISIAKKLSSFKYCTIPVHKQWLFYGIICVALIAFAGYIIYKLKRNDKTVKITAVMAVIALFINISIPILPTRYSNSLTVLSAGNNMHVIVQSGTHYMYIVNADEAVPTEIYSYLPKATCESLDYYVATFLSYNAVSDLQKIKNHFQPEQTHITPSIKYIAETNDIETPDNSVISVTGKYILNSEITVEIVDTYRIKYAIIEGNEKTVYIHLHGDSDFSEVIDTTPGDVFIYNGKLSEDIPENAETIILNADSSFIKDKSLKAAKESCSEFYVTAQNGDVQIII